MVTGKEELMELAVRIASSAEEEYDGRWCFFAGFAFVLNGVEKTTYDIDLLTKDQETFQHITTVLLRIGMDAKATTKNFSSFKITFPGLVKVKELTLDLLCISSEWLKPLKGMWEALEGMKIDGSVVPVASAVYLILLKVLVNSHRQLGDRKKQQDLVDVRQLMSIRGITEEQVRNEAKRQGLEDVTLGFLSKLKATYPSG